MQILRLCACACSCALARVLVRLHQERAAQKEVLLKGHGFHVCVTTYETVAQEIGCLKKMEFEMLVIDEAHRLKNESSKLATLLRQLTSTRRLLLTGTPIQNNLHELWALLNFLYPEGVMACAEPFLTLQHLSSVSKTFVPEDVISVPEDVFSMLEDVISIIRDVTFLVPRPPKVRS